MAASVHAGSLPQVRSPFLCAALACTVIGAVNQATAQSSLDDIHITPPEATVAVAKADYSPDLALAARAPSIRTNVDLVLVPVSVTDGMQRLVTGLDQGPQRGNRVGRAAEEDDPHRSAPMRSA